MSEKKNYSFELQGVLSYMIDILANEFPVDIFTPEYLIVSILDTKKCHANMFLDNYLMSENMEELREIYTSVLRENKVPILKDKNKEKVEFNFELNKIMEKAEVEANKLGSSSIGTEHILLSILNPENEIKIRDVFTTVGIDYELIFNKCKDSRKTVINNRKNAFINNKGTNQQTPKMIPLKSEINATITVGDAEYISKYTTNINNLVKENKIDDLVGREKETNQILKVLSRRRKNNVVLVGPGGVGKTAIVQNLAKLIESGNVPSFMEGKKLVMLDIMALVSGTQLRGMYEERVNGLFKELKNSKKHILFIDDIHTVLKSGSRDNDKDLSGMLGEILLNGDVKIIGTTTNKEYRNSIETNPGISNKFQKIMIEPSTVDETIEILKKNKKYYEEYHNVEYTDDAIKKCAELSERYITDRKLPDSAFDILDLSGAYVSLIKNESLEFSELKKRLSKIEEEKNEILNNGDFEKIDALTIEENDIKKRISDFKRNNKKKKQIVVNSNDILNTVSDSTGIPVTKLSNSEKEKIAHIDKKLKEDIVGQDEAIDEICKIIKRNRVGLGSKKKCSAAFLCCGKSGVGKTFLAKRLAAEIFGDENAMIRIDMSEYSEKNSIAKLTGTAQGYVGYEDGGILTTAIKNKPYSVVLLDEIEKADESIFNLFLQIFDEGRLTESNGTVVNCKNCLFIMTSNIGAKQASELGKGIGFVTNEADNKKAIIEKELKSKFTPEFLNRIDKIVYFNSLTDDNLKDIVNLEIKKLNKRLKEIDYSIQYDDKVVNFIHEQAVKQKEYGARPIIRLIQNNLEDSITDLLLENEYEPEYVFSATCNSGKIEIK